MRYAIVVLVLLTLACSKKESPSEAGAAAKAPTAEADAEGSAPPAPEVDPRLAEPPPTKPPVVELITAGKPPLEKVRWTFSEGANEVMEVTIAQVIEMKGGTWDNRIVPVSIAQTIDVTTQAVSADGTAQVAFHIREVAELETKDANSAPTEGAKGATGTYKVDSTGVVQDFVLVPPPDSKYKASDLDMIKGLLRSSIFAVPTEAIGVGAKWTVSQVVNEHKMPMNEQMAIELVKRTDSELVLRVQIEGHGTREGKVGEQHQTISLDVDTELLAKLSPTKLVPRSVELENQTIQTVKPEGVDDPKEQLRITIDRTVEMRSK